MIVPRQIKARVEAKVAECFKIASERYERSFRLPDITYKVRGVVAGKANSTDYELKLNSVLLMENLDEMIDTRTVPHECAHLIAHLVYGDRIQSHGREWKSVMFVLGVEARRTHSYNVRNARVGGSFDYHCGCKVHEVSVHLHRNMMKRKRYYTCKHCNGRLVRVDHSIKEAAQTAPQTVSETKSKWDHCKAIYLRNLSRKRMIERFVEIAGCTPKGALTYYYKCKKLYG